MKIKALVLLNFLRFWRWSKMEVTMLISKNNELKKFLGLDLVISCYQIRFWGQDDKNISLMIKILLFKTLSLLKFPVRCEPLFTYLNHQNKWRVETIRSPQSFHSAPHLFKCISLELKQTWLSSVKGKIKLGWMVVEANLFRC